MGSLYQVNKGINKPIEFKGLKAQYIWYLGAGLVLLLIVFAVMYIFGLNTFICLGLIVTLAVMLFMLVYHMSHKYGEHGLMKKMARKNLPSIIKNGTRKIFVCTWKNN